MKRIMNKHVPTIINAFGSDFVEQKTHQITEFFSFRTNTKQIKSDIPQSILNLCYNRNLLDFFPMPNRTENQSRTKAEPCMSHWNASAIATITIMEIYKWLAPILKMFIRWN